MNKLIIIALFSPLLLIGQGADLDATLEETEEFLTNYINKSGWDDYQYGDKVYRNGKKPLNSITRPVF